MSRPNGSWHPVCCATLTIAAITTGMLLDGAFDVFAALLLLYPALLLLHRLASSFRRT